MPKINIMNRLAILALAFLAAGTAMGQSVGSAGTPSTLWDCDEYMWPETPSPCPEVQIKQKHDHTPIALYRERGWDTVVTCDNREIILSCTPNIPVQRFNGTYYVDEIPYDPADPTFALGTRMPISTDDNFSNMETNIPYPFYFFGYRKTKFVLGANGLVAFGPVPVTNTTGTGPSCPWRYTASLPWTSSTTGTPSNLEYMRDAIYGVYEDSYPSPSVHGSTGEANWGIYYGIQGERPCRKIICSWNDIPQFSCTSLRESYQIVCYEGSNIIEVHVKQRQVCTTWNNGNGIIGIQNSTGMNQVRNESLSQSTVLSAITGKPGAFAPNGYNKTTSSFSNKAFRFTPAGLTSRAYGWYRIRTKTDTICNTFRVDTTWTDYTLDTTWTDTVIASIDTTWTTFRLDTVCTNFTLNTYTVNDTLRNSEVYWDAQYDDAGYMEPMHDDDDTWPCKSLTKAHIHPKVPTRYVFFLNFKNANQDWYNLADTILVGVDTLDYLNLHKAEVRDTLPSLLDVCIGDTARMRVDMNKLQTIAHEEWSVFRVSDGDTLLLGNLEGNGEGQLNNTYLKIDNYRMVPVFRVAGNDTTALDPMLYPKDEFDKVGDTAKTRSLVIYTRLLPNTGHKDNKIDTIIVRITADYVSGCHSFDTMMIRIFPLFDTIVEAGICRGDTYTWSTNGRTYTESTNPATTLEHLRSRPGCDSTVRLSLTVMDVSLTIDPIEDCKPVTWLNGQTYTTSNTATALTDTIILKNRWGCDSVVRLDFTIYPLTAKFQADIKYFTIDNLNTELTDLSINGDSRVWKFPDGPDQTGSTAYYTVPVESDGADITLIESSRFGCVDTAKIYIPLNKEYFWVPNAFTPDNPAGNNLFGSVSEKTLYQEMHIYNRRGELVFHCEGVDCKWDGHDLNGKPCIQGAYVYVIRYTNQFEPQETRVLKGTVTLIR